VIIDYSEKLKYSEKSIDQKTLEKADTDCGIHPWG